VGSAEAVQVEAGRTKRMTSNPVHPFWRHKKMRHYGKIWIALVVILVVILLFGLGIFRWYISGYNKAIRLDEAAKTAWSNVDAALQRRLDLVPNLVETVKGYAEHEKELFENIANSRVKYFQAGSVAGKIEASNELSGFLSRLLFLSEAYPELKANQNFLALQDQLEGTENRIAVARNRYNEAAKLLNAYTREFFGSFFCNRAKVESMDYFEASEKAKTEVPKVDFNS
jgi:LemA protein